VLTALTKLYVWEVTGLSPESPPLTLPGLQDLELCGGDWDCFMPLSYLASCTQLRFLKSWGVQLTGPGSLVTSTMLQHLELDGCSIAAADGAAALDWGQQVFPGPGPLPHLTSLQFVLERPQLKRTDIDRMAACCSSLWGVNLSIPVGSFAPALMRLRDLTNLQVLQASAEDYGALAQLTGLRQLIVGQQCDLSAVALKEVAALNQLTSLGIGSISCCSELRTLADHLMLDRLPHTMLDRLSHRPYAIVNKGCVCGGGGMRCTARLELCGNHHFTIALRCVWCGCGSACHCDLWAGAGGGVGGWGICASQAGWWCRPGFPNSINTLVVALPQAHDVRGMSCILCSQYDLYSACNVFRIHHAVKCHYEIAQNAHCVFLLATVINCMAGTKWLFP